jgi:PPM family protein phosphatase
MTISWGEKMQIRPDNAQHIGAREQQEDSFGFSSFDQTEIINKRGFTAVLADGMGGMTHGSEVSQLAVQSFLSYYQDVRFEEDVPTLLHDALIYSNSHVQQFAETKGLENQVGSTLIAATVKDGHLYWISIGDSRIYLYRHNELIQLTEDHVYAKVLNEEAAKGTISKEEAETHPQRAALTSFLGLEEITEIDQNVVPFPLKVGDRILLCSDGLYGFMSEGDIVQLLSDNKDGVCDLLVNKVLDFQHPFQDNITAVLLECKKENQTARIENITTFTEITDDPPSRSKSELKRKRRYFPFLLTLLLILILLTGGLASYYFYGKDGSFNEIKSKVLKALHLNEKTETKQTKEGDKNK